MGNFFSSSSSASESDTWRRRADEHATRRRQLAAQSQEAFRRGDKAAAKKLSEQAKAERQEMVAANARAAQLAFEAANEKHGDGTIDLHGLHTDEALRYLQERVDKCRKLNASSLVIIVGVGNHSVNNIPKLKPLVQKFVTDNNLYCIPDNPNQGCIFIDFTASETSRWCTIL
eukprot:TRINITY_DN9217_c0_g1_i1.p1 TRINITY_DN9217_c0_g1~~TRINITY_DN9217_c0_g1_i1.p1  ORF type:complete len:173 (+),score=64.43 TRINITY_DN9217_c0_g1_i1:437-955(+)